MDHADIPTLIDIPTLTARLGISVRHVRRLIAEGRIPHHKVGGLIRFDPAEIIAWPDTTHRPAQPATGHARAVGER